MNPRKVLCTSLPLYGVVFYTLCHNLICDTSHFLPPNTTMSVLQKPQVCVRVGRFFFQADYDTLSCFHTTPIFLPLFLTPPLARQNVMLITPYPMLITFFPYRTNCHENNLELWKKSRIFRVVVGGSRSAHLKKVKKK